MKSGPENGNEKGDILGMTGGHPGILQKVECRLDVPQERGAFLGGWEKNAPGVGVLSIDHCAANGPGACVGTLGLPGFRWSPSGH